MYRLVPCWKTFRHLRLNYLTRSLQLKLLLITVLWWTWIVICSWINQVQEIGLSKRQYAKTAKDFEKLAFPNTFLRLLWAGKNLFLSWFWFQLLDWSFPISTQNTPPNLLRLLCPKQAINQSVYLRPPIHLPTHLPQASNVSYTSLLCLKRRTGVLALDLSLLSSVQTKTVLWPTRENQRTLMLFYFTRGTSSKRFYYGTFPKITLTFHDSGSRSE